MSKKLYSFWYTESDTFKGYFRAEDKAQARALLLRIQNGELDTTDLADWDSKSKDYALELDIDTLEELEG
jgi:hypothetical protein